MTRWGMVIDLQTCVGCHSCSAACKATNGTPPDIFFSRVHEFESGEYPNARREFLPVLCNHCEDPPCVKVCPTGAIWEITQAEKAWLPATSKPGAKPISLGTAFYDRGRCLPWAMATECIVCEEWCPTSPKAIYLVEADVEDARGNFKRVRQPHVDPARCVGCGACEFACPVKDQPAIYVSSIGESRSRTNQILLQRVTREPQS